MQEVVRYSIAGLVQDISTKEGEGTVQDETEELQANAMHELNWVGVQK